MTVRHSAFTRQRKSNTLVSLRLGVMVVIGDCYISDCGDGEMLVMVVVTLVIVVMGMVVIVVIGMVVVTV